MSKEKGCKCCKQIWYVDMLDKKLKLCPNCYEYCKPLFDDLKIKDKQIAKLEAKLAEKDKENATLEAMLAENAIDRKTMQEYKIGEDEYDLTDEDARNSLCWEVEQLKQQLHDLPKKIVEEISKELKSLYKNYPIIYSENKDIVKSCYDKDSVNKILDTILKKYGGEDE